MKQIRILKNFNLFLIYRVYLIVFATVLITYEQNYTYTCIFKYTYWNPSLSFRSLSVTCQLEKEIRKIDGKTRRQVLIFVLMYSFPEFSQHWEVLPLLHTYIVYHIDCVLWEPPRKYQFSGGFNANFFGTWTNCSNLFSYCRSNRRPCQLVIIHRAKKRNREGRN